MAGGTLGCDLGAPETDSATRGLDTPPVHITGAWVTTGYDERGQPQRTALTEGAIVDGVRETTSLAVELDRFVLPASAIRQAICVRPSTSPVEQLSDCAEPRQPFLEPSYSPARRRVIFRQRSGESLSPDTLYRLTAYVPSEDEDYGFRAFDGRPLARAYQFDFRTAAAGTVALEEALPAPERYCHALDCVDGCRAAGGDPEQQQGCIDDSCHCLDEACFADGDLTDAETGAFAASCAFGGCHARQDPAPSVPWGAGAAMGLDLSAPEAIEQTAVGQPAHQSQAGERAYLPELSPQRFGRAMPIVSRANPGNSYLLYKLLLQPEIHQAAGLSSPADQAELARLRASVVVGLPMPPDHALISSSLDPSGAQSWQRLLLLESWIAHGAVTRCP